MNVLGLRGKMEIAIMTGFFAKWDMNIDACHSEVISVLDKASYKLLILHQDTYFCNVCG